MGSADDQASRMREGTVEVVGAGEAGRARDRSPSGSARGRGGVRTALRARLAAGLADAGFDLEDVTVTRAGSRSVVRVVVDRDGGVDLDAVADASRLASELLDAAETDGQGLVAGPYVLEVTSPGVERPLTEPRHWRRAIGRLVTVRDRDGIVLAGRVLSADESGADLAVATDPARPGRPPRRRLARVTFAQVARATVEVEFSAEAYDDLSIESVETPSLSAVLVEPGETADLGYGEPDDDLPAAPGRESNDDGREAGPRGAAGKEMTR
ncbi:ribosome maturation factor RimP [Frankia sp. B2]|uniref:Ribosome maturation factor RimP n=3 Tax=Frankiaceae TaxID=74712 RepID=RIMP_FRACC|nr:MULTISPECIES: ribosome maturation factor RimP [unclassified Frankia]Q2J725.1 RecName: Full=Ribosome maturation factor RimP [Frankia casuarinae]ABD12917.1 protein of unknown function DUF150 [Frankia casuarinae]OHV55754.1 ribosome maturation factor [Frankia sp. CgIS1]TFE31380.1 ribosome maturation factor RimP [Frankia sp. B2]